MRSIHIHIFDIFDKYSRLIFKLLYSHVFMLCFSHEVSVDICVNGRDLSGGQGGRGGK